VLRSTNHCLTVTSTRNQAKKRSKWDDAGASGESSATSTGTVGGSSWSDDDDASASSSQWDAGATPRRARSRWDVTPAATPIAGATVPIYFSLFTLCYTRFAPLKCSLLGQTIAMGRDADRSNAASDARRRAIHTGRLEAQRRTAADDASRARDGISQSSANRRRHRRYAADRRLQNPRRTSTTSIPTCAYIVQLISLCL
jgi:hypothetical protein